MADFLDYVRGFANDFDRGLQVMGEGARNLPGNFVAGLNTLANSDDPQGAFRDAALGFAKETGQEAFKQFGDLNPGTSLYRGTRYLSGLDPSGSMKDDLQNLGVPAPIAGGVGAGVDFMGQMGSPGSVARTAVSTVRQVPGAAAALGESTANFLNDTASTMGKGTITPQDLLKNTSFMVEDPGGMLKFGAPLSTTDRARALLSNRLAQEQAAQAGSTNAGWTGYRPGKGPLVFANDVGLDQWNRTVPHEGFHAQAMEAAAQNLSPVQMPTPWGRLTAELQRSGASPIRGIGNVANELGARIEGEGDTLRQAADWLTNPRTAAAYFDQFAAADPSGFTNWLMRRASGPAVGATLRGLGSLADRTPAWAQPAATIGAGAAGIYALQPPRRE